MKKNNFNKISCFCLCFALIISFMIFGALATDECAHDAVVNPTSYESTSSTTHVKKTQCGHCMEVLVSVPEDCNFDDTGMCVCGNCNHTGGQAGVSLPSTYVIASSTTHIMSSVCGMCSQVVSSVEQNCVFVSGVCVCGNCNHQGGSGVSIPSVYEKTSGTTHIRKNICGVCQEIVASVSEECDFSSGTCACGNICTHSSSSIDYLSLNSTTHSVSDRCDGCGYLIKYISSEKCEFTIDGDTCICGNFDLGDVSNKQSSNQSSADKNVSLNFIPLLFMVVFAVGVIAFVYIPKRKG